MDTKIIAMNATVGFVIAAMGLSGCATTAGDGSVGNVSSGQPSGECNAGVAAGIGAVIGALVTNGNDRVKGATVGAGLGALACMAWNYQSKQTKTAEQTQREYKTSNAGRLPSETKVVRYDVRLDPAAVVKPGNQVSVVSDVDLVQGASDKARPLIEQELVLVRPDGKETKARKAVNEGAGAGGYQSSYTLAMPQGVPQGVYPLRAVLFLNGQQVSTKNLTLQVVTAPSGTQSVAFK